MRKKEPKEIHQERLRTRAVHDAIEAKASDEAIARFKAKPYQLQRSGINQPIFSENQERKSFK